jgi:hypothetical protein
MPVKPSPSKIIINSVGEVGTATRTIQIVDPQVEKATIRSGYIMGDFGRVYMAKMQGASGAWCKSRNHDALLP